MHLPWFFENFVTMADMAPQDGILPILMDGNQKIAMGGSIDFGKLAKIMFDNPNKYSTNKIDDIKKSFEDNYNNYAYDVIENYYTNDQVANLLNTILGFIHDEDKTRMIVAQNVRKQFPLNMFGSVMRRFSPDLDEWLKVGDFFADWKSKPNMKQAKDILSENNIKMQTLYQFIKDKMSSDECKAKFCGKKSRYSLFTMSNINVAATVAIIGGVGYGALWYYKSEYNGNQNNEKS